MAVVVAMVVVTPLALALVAPVAIVAPVSLVENSLGDLFGILMNYLNILWDSARLSQFSMICANILERSPKGVHKNSIRHFADT